VSKSRSAFRRSEVLNSRASVARHGQTQHDSPVPCCVPATAAGMLGGGQLVGGGHRGGPAEAAENGQSFSRPFCEGLRSTQTKMNGI